MPYAIQLWGNVLKNLKPDIIDRAICQCVMTMYWPPSIAEFLDIYDKESGIPSVSEIIKKVIGRQELDEFSKAIYLEVGSWAFQSDTEKVLKKKVEEAYKKCLSDSRAKIIGIDNLFLENKNDPA